MIRSKHDRRSTWDPLRDTHRGRVTREYITTSSGERYIRISLHLKPTKTDPTGKEKWVKTFRVDDDPTSISAGYAILLLLAEDPAPGDPTSIPLFLNPQTGLEITYNEPREALERILRDSGFGSLGKNKHSLRIGGATALANDEQGGDFVTGCMGLWKGNSRAHYMHALRERLEAAGYSIGRGTGGALAERPGPLSRCGL